MGSPEQVSPSSPNNFADAIRYWEWRRIAYNAVLAAVVIAWVAAGWAHFRPAFAWINLGRLVILAVLANVCYSAAYLVDLPMQFAGFGAFWRKRRWALWVFGMLFAILLANYWIADEIYPYIPR